MFVLYLLGLVSTLHAQKIAPITISSPTIIEGQRIPDIHTCLGANTSPELTWIALPENTHSLALICADPDSPSGEWIHWVIYNIPAVRNTLPAALPPQQKLLEAVTQGRNSYAKIGYNGACPPKNHGVHRYFFKLYALDLPPDFPENLDASALRAAMKGHIIGYGQLMGTYSRP